MSPKCKPSDIYLLVPESKERPPVFSKRFSDIIEAALAASSRLDNLKWYAKGVLEIKNDLARGLFADWHVEYMGKVFRGTFFNARHEQEQLWLSAPTVERIRDVIQFCETHDYRLYKQFQSLASRGMEAEFEGFLNDRAIRLIRESSTLQVKDALEEKLRQDLAILNAKEARIQSGEPLRRVRI